MSPERARQYIEAVSPHRCPSCTPELYLNRPPICPRCGASMPNSRHESGWALDVCLSCDDFMNNEETDR